MMPAQKFLIGPPLRFIECYYNRVRKHSSLGYKSPEQVESEYYKNLQV